MRSVVLIQRHLDVALFAVLWESKAFIAMLNLWGSTSLWSEKQLSPLLLGIRHLLDFDSISGISHTKVHDASVHSYWQSLWYEPETSWYLTCSVKMSYDIGRVIFSISRILKTTNQPTIDAPATVYNRKLKKIVHLSYGMCCIFF